MGEFETVFTIQDELSTRIAPQPQPGNLDGIIEKLGLDC